MKKLVFALVFVLVGCMGGDDSSQGENSTSDALKNNIIKTSTLSDNEVKRSAKIGKEGEICQESKDCFHGFICGESKTCEKYIETEGKECSNSLQELTCVERKDGVAITALNKCWVAKMDVKVLHEGACEQ